MGLGLNRHKRYSTQKNYCTKQKASKLLLSFGQICQQFYRNLAEEEEEEEEEDETKADQEAISKLAAIL
jgi:deoxyribodipyrimidine photolyase